MPKPKKRKHPRMQGQKVTNREHKRAPQNGSEGGQQGFMAGASAVFHHCVRP